MALKLKGSTSGFTAIDAPAVAGDNTLVLPADNGSASQYLQTNGSGVLSWQTVTDTSTSVAVLADEKSQGTAAGTFTSGDWRTRDLNTEAYDPDSIVTLSSNQFTLGAGTYLIYWDCPAHRVQRHQSRLYDVTGTAEVETGVGNFASTAENIANISPGSAVVTPTASNTYEIQHRCQATQSNNGLGVESNFGTERYTQVTIWKVA